MQQQFIGRDVRRKERFQVDDEYMNGYAKLCGIHATGVYMALCRHANREQEAWPSMERIAEKLGLSRTTVHKAIKTLESWGIVGILRGKTTNGRQDVNVYVLTDKSTWRSKEAGPCTRREHGTVYTAGAVPCTPTVLTACTGRKQTEGDTDEGMKSPVDKSTEGRPKSLFDVFQEMVDAGTMKPYGKFQPRKK